MNFKKLKHILSYALLSGITFTSCTNEGNIDNSSITEETRYANKFTKEVLEMYYYWNNEISQDLNKLDPEKNSDPIATVEEIRYHDGKIVPLAIKDWGIYVMVSIYKNANDETPCMPNGLTPYINAEDYPLEAYQLGNENEAMLKAALQRAGKVYPESRCEKNICLILKQ